MRVFTRIASFFITLAGFGLIFVLRGGVEYVFSTEPLPQEYCQLFMNAASLLPIPFMVACASFIFAPPARTGSGRIAVRIFQWAMLIEGLSFLAYDLMIGYFLGVMDPAFAILFTLCIFFPLVLSGMVRALLSEPRRKGKNVSEEMSGKDADSLAAPEG